MKPIYIVGAGGLGKEIFSLIEDINKVHFAYNIKGFLDTDDSKKELKIGKKYIKIFNEIKFIEENRDDSAINIAIAIGTPRIISKVVESYKTRTKFIFPNLIHPSVFLKTDTLEIDEGNIIMPKSIISVDVKLSSFNIINLNCSIGHDSKLGSFNVINPGANISGGVKIGNNNLIGTNATILQYLDIGNNNTISAASFIAKNIEDNQILIGNPGRAIGLNKSNI